MVQSNITRHIREQRVTKKKKKKGKGGKRAFQKIRERSKNLQKS